MRVQMMAKFHLAGSIFVIVCVDLTNLACVAQTKVNQNVLSIQTFCTLSTRRICWLWFVNTKNKADPLTQSQ